MLRYFGYGRKRKPRKEIVEPAELHEVPGFGKREDVVRLVKRKGLGVELGVATGAFSARILEAGVLSHLYSIDMWAGDRGHGIRQYKKAIRTLTPHRKRNTILKMRFDEALDLFPDEHFDFIYIDGYAHTGEEAGQTLRDWWPKLKRGGIFAGDDYAQKYRLVIEEVDRFVAEHRLPLQVLRPHGVVDKWSANPSWVTVKPADPESRDRHSAAADRPHAR